MRLTAFFLWLALLQCQGEVLANTPLSARQLRPRDYQKKDYYAFELANIASPDVVARHFGLEYEGPIGELANHHLFSGSSGKRDIVGDKIQIYRERRKRDAGPDPLYESILFAEKQKLKKLVKRQRPPPPSSPPPLRRQSSPDDGRVILEELMEVLDIHDPIFYQQWHLFNPIQRGNDVNVTGVWKQGITGHNVTVSIVDDGLDMYSDDLKDNYFPEGSYDFNDNEPEPKPRLSDDRHGTRCAGEVAAVKNDVCGVGVAWNSRISGIRILSKQITDADEAIALNYAYHDNHIYSCSWGPPDDGRAMDAPGILIKRAMVNGIQNGRHGLGSVFVFASGNGAGYDDNCNFDGYTNSIYSITVGAIDRKGEHPYYSESCSANMVVTYSSGSNDAIHTTDVGTNACSGQHGGTSAAAPLAAGIFALVLSVRPDLTWRDLQYLCVETALQVQDSDPDWETTAIGKKFNHRYGYGSLDAYAIVEAAKTWQLVKPQAWFHSPLLVVNTAIPEGSVGLRSHISINAEDLKSANFERVEHVTVTINLRHQRRGDVMVDLISPKGIVSHIATARRDDNSPHGYDNWTFMSVKHWGEDGIGDWTIMVMDKVTNGQTGTLVDWKITIWGESLDPEQAVLHPLPGDPMNNTHPIPHPFTSTASVHTTSIQHTSTSEAPLSTPSDHIERPVNSKPKPSESSNSVEPTDAASNTSIDPALANTDLNNDRPQFLPSFLPTFGVSGKTQGWIYGALVIIVLFIAGVAIYLCVQRRKRRATSSNYEFAVLEDDDYDGEGAMPGGSNRRRAAVGTGRRKAKELYDAFGASDDEEEEDIFSDDDEEKQYRNVRERDYELEVEEEIHGIDEGKREIGGDREALLGRSRG
ncbi:peptidase S8/S53 domain-containing protein [Kalaharituber pfeilii]|nr:peptidase S8/S53 domain-containing protein [Kalaharituber pfeilii]